LNSDVHFLRKLRHWIVKFSGVVKRLVARILKEFTPMRIPLGPTSKFHQPTDQQNDHLLTINSAPNLGFSQPEREPS